MRTSSPFYERDYFNAPARQLPGVFRDALNFSRGRERTQKAIQCSWSPAAQAAVARAKSPKNSFDVEGSHCVDVEAI